MAGPHGRARVALSEHLLREPFAFDWFQAVRVLERWSRKQSRRRPSDPIGGDAAPEQEHIRFRVLVSQAFPTSPLAQVRDVTAASPLEAIVTFFGLFGPHSVLPAHYTSLLLRRVRMRDYALRDFLDLFHHRALSHFYKAWEKYRLPAAFDRAALDRTTDPITQSVFCLTGYGTAGLRGRSSAPDSTFLYYAGHFAHFPRSAAALASLLSDYFGVSVSVTQAVGQWLMLADADGSCMPNDEHPDGRNNELGMSLIIGERVWDVQSKFAVRLGPLRYSEFRTFMPDGDGLRSLVELVRAYVGSEFDFDVVPLLLPTEAPLCELVDGPEAPRLGWNAWMHDGDYVSVIADAVFPAAAIEA
jgi:type VI secretion system protein ImpH